MGEQDTWAGLTEQERALVEEHAAYWEDGRDDDWCMKDTGGKNPVHCDALQFAQALAAERRLRQTAIRLLEWIHCEFCEVPLKETVAEGDKLCDDCLEQRQLYASLKEQP